MAQYATFGTLPQPDPPGSRFDLPGGVLFDGDLGTFRPLTKFDDPTFRDGVVESIARSWYDGDWTRHPWEEETVPRFTDFDPDGKYSWVKAPRFDGGPMQVGPLAQVLVGHAAGDERITARLTDAVDRVSAIAGAKIGLAALRSTLGRHLARAVRDGVLADLALVHWGHLMENIGTGDTRIWVEPVFPRGEQRGFGFHEAARGTLSHWIVIRDGRIANYQAVVPSTWNAGPRDARDQRGPYEESLLDNPVADRERPLELLRILTGTWLILPKLFLGRSVQGRLETARPGLRTDRLFRLEARERRLRRRRVLARARDSEHGDACDQRDSRDQHDSPPFGL